MKKLTHKEFSARGGKARAKKLTKEQRSEIARKGGLSRRKAPVDNSVDNA